MSDINVTASSGLIEGKPCKSEFKEPLPNTQTSNGDAQVDQRFDFPPLPDDFGESPCLEPFLSNEWLLSRNEDLQRLLVEQGKRQQGQALIFNNVWGMLSRTTKTNEALQSEWHELVTQNHRLRSDFANAQYALAVERYHQTAARNNITIKDDLIQSLRNDLSTQREFRRLLQEQLFQVTQALLATTHAPQSDEATNALKESYQAQLNDNERLRMELEASRSQPTVLPSNLNAQPPHLPSMSGQTAQRSTQIDRRTLHPLTLNTGVGQVDIPPPAPSNGFQQAAMMGSHPQLDANQFQAQKRNLKKGKPR
ncbi:hypothetical protein Q7P35_008937 [Cladosporium inversicolor]